MPGFGGLLRLVPITVEALLSVTAAALSGFGVFFRVSFGLGHDALLRIVIISLPDIKETMSHLVSIASVQTSGDAPVAMRAHKPFIRHNFHGVPSGRQGQFSLKFTFGKARFFLSAHRTSPWINMPFWPDNMISVELSDSFARCCFSATRGPLLTQYMKVSRA